MASWLKKRMKIWEYEGYIKIHPFLKQNEVAEFQFAFFTVDPNELCVYFAPMDKDYQWTEKDIKQYLAGLQMALKKLQEAKDGR